MVACERDVVSWVPVSRRYFDSQIRGRQELVDQGNRVLCSSDGERAILYVSATYHPIFVGVFYRKTEVILHVNHNQSRLGRGHDGMARICRANEHFSDKEHSSELRQRSWRFPVLVDVSPGQICKMEVRMVEVEVEVVRWLKAGRCQDFTSAAVGVFDLSACSNLPSIPSPTQPRLLAEALHISL